MRALDAARRSHAIWQSPAREVLASVGVYQLEGLGVHLFEAIEGDHTTILGLPMLKLLACLRREGAAWRYERSDRAARWRLRLAGRPFALAAHSWLLAANARPRGRL